MAEPALTPSGATPEPVAPGHRLRMPTDAGAAVIVFVLALIPRLLHLQQIRQHDPFFLLPEVDGAVYHAWAQSIAGGDLVGEGVLIMGPLYPYLMGALYALVGPDLLVLKALQALLGALSCCLVWRLARDCFDARVALCAGVVAALDEMLIFYGGTVMLESVQVPLVLAVLIGSLRALERPSAARWFGVGVGIGLCALARQTMLLYAPLIGLWLLASLRTRLPARRRLALLAALAIGVASMIAPFTLRNGLVAGDWVLVNSTGGANLYMGNGPQANGSWQPPDIARGRIDNPLAMREAFTAVAEARTGRALRPSEVSAYWSREALRSVLDRPLAWLELETIKLLYFLNAEELADNQSIVIARQFSRVLQAPLFGLGLILPLGLLGMGLAAPRWRALLPLHAVLGVHLCEALVFFVLSRYRMPAVPALIVFAAFAGVRLADAVRHRERWVLAHALVPLLALAAITNVRFPGRTLYMAHFNLGNQYLSLGEHARAIESYQRALAEAPSFLPANANLALAYEQAGRRDEAFALWRHVLAWSITHDDPAAAENARRHLESLEAPADPLAP